MLASRPPLNCQKCQWRFFTDQGLERHLLGAHGLVTSNMQDMVNQNQDGGRCTICGRVFANKLVAHMNQVISIFFKLIQIFNN
jgi:rubredoxin